MSWSSKRRSTIILGFLTLVVIPIAIVAFFVFYNAPTCTDEKQNGDESGVDCGGTCPNLCINSIPDPVVHWSRYFAVSPGFYNAVAYVENPNTEAGIKSVNYVFKLYDEFNVLVSEKSGSIEILPQKVVPIIASAFNTGTREVKRMTFDFVGPINWERMKVADQKISVTKEKLTDEEVAPRITAQVKNLTIQQIRNVEFAAILYGLDGNAIAFSKTFLDVLPSEGEKEIFFVCPNPFSEKITKFEIIPLNF